MDGNKTMEHVISRYRDFFESKYGLYLLRILTECDLAEEDAAPKEFGPLYAAFTDDSSPDNSLELYNYFSNQDEIIEEHKEIHRFYNMILKVLYSIKTTYKCNIDGAEQRFLSVKDAIYGDISVSMPDLILDTIGGKKQVSISLAGAGVEDKYVKACTKRRRIALDKFYSRLYYNTELEIATYLDENRNNQVYDFTDQICFDIIDIITSEHQRGFDPLSKKETRQVIKNYFTKNIQKGLSDISDMFYETLNISASTLTLDSIIEQHDTCFDGTYKRVIPHSIQVIQNTDGTYEEVCTAPKRAYTCEYLLKIDGEIRGHSKTPVFTLDAGTSLNHSIQVLGISDENQLYLAADAARSGLFDSKNTDFIKLLGAGRTSELRTISCYFLRMTNAMDTLFNVNPLVFQQLGAMFDNPRLTFDALADLYFLMKFV